VTDEVLQQEPVQAAIDRLFAAELLTLVLFETGGTVIVARGGLLGDIASGIDIYEAVPFLDAYAQAIEGIAAGDQPPLTLENIDLAMLDPHAVHDGTGQQRVAQVRFLPVDAGPPGQVVMVLLDRTAEAGLQQQVMQQRNELHLVRGELEQRSAELATAHAELDRAHRLLAERFDAQSEALEDTARRLVDEIAARADVETRVWDMMHYDQTSGLPNRLLFLDRLAAMLDHAAIVLLIDVDGFHTVTEALGPEAGEETIRRVGAALRDACAPNDFLAHLSGDRFAVVATDDVTAGGGESDLLAKAERLRMAVRRSLALTEGLATLTASVGIAVGPRDAAEPAELLRCAEMALYRAKARGGNDISFYETGMNEAVAERWQMVNALRAAVSAATGSGGAASPPTGPGSDGTGLVLYYQPQIDLATGRIAGAEALCRWFDPVLGAVSPTRFIPLAEQTGMTRDLGIWAIETVCRQIAGWQTAGLGRLKVAVNLSADQFTDRNLTQLVADTLAATRIDPACLELEITETVAMDDASASGTIFEELLSLGVRLSIDDFGTGYSSLAYLQTIPVHKVKIDQAFVRDIAPNGDPGKVAGAVIQLCHSFGLKVIAEGVETDYQRQFLVDRSCDQAQGFFYAKPLSPSAFEAFVREGP